jgi:hypothetical protein
MRIDLHDKIRSQHKASMNAWRVRTRQSPRGRRSWITCHATCKHCAYDAWSCQPTFSQIFQHYAGADLTQRIWGARAPWRAQSATYNRGLRAVT